MIVKTETLKLSNLKAGVWNIPDLFSMLQLCFIVMNNKTMFY